MPDQKYTFRSWMRDVDDRCWTLSGVSIHDLPDQPFRDWHNDEVAAEDAAVYALQDAGCTFV